MDKMVIVCSVHDVTPRHFARLVQVDALLQEYGLRGRYAMFVVPDFWGEWSLRDNSEFVAWLRDRAMKGVEMVLHGYTHRDDTEHNSRFRRWQARTLTAREGEFLGLDAGAARERLLAGREMLESLLKSQIHGFVAPAWLYGAATHQVLRELNFAFAEDHWKVWSPSDGRTLAVGPVVSYASRDRLRIAGSLLWSRLATIALRSAPTVRLAIHPHDLDNAHLLDEIRRALASLLRYRTPVGYLDLVNANIDSIAVRGA